MNTTGIKEDTNKKYDFAQNYHRYAEAIMKVEGVPDADATEGIALEISEEGLQKSKEMQEKTDARHNSKDQQYSQSQMKMFREEMERMRESNEKAAEHADDMSKIMTIFRRIANGDIVPPRDEKKLMEHSMEMYQAAKNLGTMKQNEERKKHKSVDEDEKDKGAPSKEEMVRALMRGEQQPIAQAGTVQKGSDGNGSAGTNLSAPE